MWNIFHNLISCTKWKLDWITKTNYPLTLIEFDCGAKKYHVQLFKVDLNESEQLHFKVIKIGADVELQINAHQFSNELLE